MNLPIAKKIPLSFELHDDIRYDEYYWMKDREIPEVIAYLEAENAYHDFMIEPLKAQVEEIYEGMIARIPKEEVEVPVQNGPYFYYSRREKELAYPIYARKYAKNRTSLETAEEEIILDLNELVGGDEFLSVAQLKISSDHRYLAYTENREGTDIYTLYVKDLLTGGLLEGVIPNVYIYGSVEWSEDRDYLFYITVDDMQRPEKLWRHRLGTPITEDVLLVEEPDATFNLYLSKSQSGHYIFVVSSATTTTEVQIIDAKNPLEAPKLFAKRKRGVELQLEHYGDGLVVLTNEAALNFKLQHCGLGDFDNLTDWIPYDEKFFLEGLYPFKGQLFVTGRTSGMEQIWKVVDDQLVPLTWDEPIYSVGLVSGQDYDAKEILVEYESFITPTTTYSLYPLTGEKSIIQKEEVTGEYIPSNYVQEQIWVTAGDGAQIPVLLHYKKGALENGTAPLILKAYGSYGISSDPYFSAYTLPILDKGVVMAVAQVRGGSELGRTWYYNGRMEHKMNTFTDYIAVADHLIATGLTSAQQLAGWGGSAGGLLMGAVANMAPDRFKVIVPAVPFVDVMTTMLDETIPLTTGEWDEWGNPKEEKAYHYMRSYSPYDNVRAQDYPHMYITTGINDPRVGYWEPAKWTARLRDLKTDQNTLLLKTNMGAGHGGASARQEKLRESAESYGFILDKIVI